MSAAPASLDGFLAANERRALRFAQLATQDADEALDLVQEAMIALARHYSGKPSEEWPALFHRILDNRIRRWRFKQLLTRRWLTAAVAIARKASAGNNDILIAGSVGPVSGAGKIVVIVVTNMAMKVISLKVR